MLLKDRPQVPMSGAQVESGFLAAFAVGIVFLLIFAWHRFNEKQGQGRFSQLRVLKDVEVSDLGGKDAMRRAYVIYAGALLIIYTAMTFFGRLLLGFASQFPEAGIRVDISSIRFDTAEWPLTLAFGLAGVGPLLPPLRIAEDWLRNRAYRAVGIPTRIELTAHRIVEELDVRTTQGIRDELTQDAKGGATS